MSKRLFLGFTVGPELFASLSEQALSYIAPQTQRLVPAENAHVTLHFLGEVEDQQIADIETQCQAIASTASPFTLEIKQLALFRRRQQPLMVALTTLPMPLANLYAAVSAGLSDLGLKVDTRPYRPHITLSRHAQDLPSLSASLSLSLPVYELVLYESVLNPAGARYQPLATFPLQPI